MRRGQSTVRLVLCSLAALLAGYSIPRADAQAPSTPVSGIYADSNARLPAVKREGLDSEARGVYDRLVTPGARYANGLRGPAGMWMYSPEFAEKATALGEVVRNSKILGPKLSELAIMVTGIELDDMTEFTGHSGGALAAGLPTAVADIVRERKSTKGIDEKEAVVIEFARQVVGKHALDRPTFDRAIALFGQRGVTDLQGVIGHYMLCNATNATFDIRPR